MRPPKDELFVRRNHIWNIRLPDVIVMFAQPAIVTGISGDAVKPKFVLCGVNFVHEAMQGKDAGALRFAEHFAGSDIMVRSFNLVR